MLSFNRYLSEGPAFFISPIFSRLRYVYDRIFEFSIFRKNKMLSPCAKLVRVILEIVSTLRSLLLPNKTRPDKPERQKTDRK
jgi:hypothetical protein